jgi:hypothetical protein
LRDLALRAVDEQRADSGEGQAGTLPGEIRTLVLQTLVAGPFGSAAAVLTAIPTTFGRQCGLLAVSTRMNASAAMPIIETPAPRIRGSGDKGSG